MLLELSQNQNTSLLPKVPDFINLDQRELILHFYKEPERHYKDITETKKSTGSTKIETAMTLCRHLCSAVGQCHCLS
jgi:murein L,D-transpeptidase YafK